MKSDPELDALVAALRDDLPSERDSLRLRARLSAVGLAASHALVSTSAAAAGAGAHGAGQAAALAAGGKVAGQAGALSLALKAGAVVVVSASVMAGPVWIAHQRWVSVAPAASTTERATLSKSRVARDATAGKREADAASSTFRDRGGAEQPLAPAEGAAPAFDAARAQARATAVNAPPADAPRASAAAPSRAGEGAETPPATAPTAVATQATAGFAKDEAAGALARPAGVNEPTTLREETLLIDAALAALRVGDAQRALDSLNEHRRRFPAGLLRRERERALDKVDELRRQPSAP